MRPLTLLEQYALKDLEEQVNRNPDSEEIVDSMKGLLEKDFISVKRLESGEFYWSATETGKEIVGKMKE